MSRAAATGLSVALSNPCFEYWLLLHFEPTGRAFPDCAAAIHALKKHLPGYQKGAAVSDDVIARRADAARRARDIDQQQWQHEPDRLRRNPSTDVYLLVEYLQEMAGRRAY